MTWSYFWVLKHGHSCLRCRSCFQHQHLRFQIKNNLLSVQTLERWHFCISWYFSRCLHMAARFIKEVSITTTAKPHPNRCHRLHGSMMSFGLVKKQRFKIVVYHEISLDDFKVLLGLLFFMGLKYAIYILIVGSSPGLLTWLKTM